MRKYPGSTGFRYYPLSIVPTSFGLCSLLPLNSGAECPGLTHPSSDMKHGKRIFSKASEGGCLCSHQRVTRYALACPGMGRGSLPLSSSTRIPFPFLSTEWIELLQKRIRTDKFSKASFPARRRQNVILMLDSSMTWCTGV